VVPYRKLVPSLRQLFLSATVALIASAGMRAQEPARFVLRGDPLPGDAVSVTTRRLEQTTAHAGHHLQAAPQPIQSGKECSCWECQLEKTTKSHSHPVYRSAEKPVCLARCGWVLFGACEECADCTPRTKRVLLKKIVTEQRPAWECKPVTVK